MWRSRLRTRQVLDTHWHRQLDSDGQRGLHGERLGNPTAVVAQRLGDDAFRQVDELRHVHRVPELEQAETVLVCEAGPPGVYLAAHFP